MCCPVKDLTLSTPCHVPFHSGPEEHQELFEQLSALSSGQSGIQVERLLEMEAREHRLQADATPKEDVVHIHIK